MSLSTHDREQKFQIQLCVQVPDSCRQDALNESLKQKFISTFCNVPLFQVYICKSGYWTPNWIMAPCQEPVACALSSLAAVAAAKILSTTDWVIFSSPWQSHARSIALNNTGCCTCSHFMPFTTWTRDGWSGLYGKRQAQNRLPGSPIFVLNCFQLFPWSPKQKYALQSSSKLVAQNSPRCWKSRDLSFLDT